MDKFKNKNKKTINDNMLGYLWAWGIIILAKNDHPVVNFILMKEKKNHWTETDINISWNFLEMISLSYFLESHLGSSPVFSRESKEWNSVYPRSEKFLSHIQGSSASSFLTFRYRESVLLRPTSISIQYDCHMFWHCPLVLFLSKCTTTNQ